MKVILTASKYVDLIDFHDYSDLPDVDFMEQAHIATGKPIVNGEFSFTALDSNMPNTHGARAGHPELTQTDRARKFTAYATLLLSKPWAIGFGWWNWVDEPSTGRWPDGENSNYGVVNLADDVYTELGAAFSAFAEGADALHASGGESDVGSGGDGRFNKAYCLASNGTWGNITVWASLIKSNTTRVAQFQTVNTTGGPLFLSVIPVAGAAFGAFALTPTPTNLTIDYGCDPRAMPSYSGIGIGDWGRNVTTWAAGPLGDLAKRGRCFFARCDRAEAEADFCGSEGEAPCSKTNATFIRYASPGASSVDTSCYSILTDSQVDPTHRVDWAIRFVDGLLLAG